jgi:hypothetical protein
MGPFAPGVHWGLRSMAGIGIGIGLAVLRRSAPLLLAGLVLAGCQVRLGAPVGLLDDPPAVERALAAIGSHFKGPVRAFKITAARNEVTFQLEHPRIAGAVAEWRLMRVRYAFLSVDRVAGPTEAKPVAVGGRYEPQFFPLADVDFSILSKFSGMAVRHAALEQTGSVSQIEIGRPLTFLEGSTAQPPRLVADVASERERARVFADLKGAIFAADLRGTARMKNLDILARPGLASEAGKAAHAFFGDKPVLVRVSINRSGVSFETTLPDESSMLAQVAPSLPSAAIFNWSLDGLTRGSGRVAIEKHVSNPPATFAVSEVDWARLPDVIAAARRAAGKPDGRVASLSLSKPSDTVGSLAVLWRVEIEESVRERTVVTLDTAGAVQHVLPPQSRRVEVNWLEPKRAAEALAALAQAFGPDARLVEIVVHDRHVSAIAEDPREPGRTMQAILRDGRFVRFGTAVAGPMAAVLGRGAPFGLDLLQDFDAARIAAFADRTLAELKMPPGSVSRITIGRGTIQSTPDHSVKVEIRADARGVGSGWGVYELDGRVVRYMRP